MRPRFPRLPRSGAPALADTRACARSRRCRPPLSAGTLVLLAGRVQSHRGPLGPARSRAGLGRAAPPPSRLAVLAAISLALPSAVSPLPVSPALELTV